jgi:apolipoprotein N-acyltransferase
MLLQIASLVGWTCLSYLVVVSGVCLAIVGLNARKRSNSRAADKDTSSAARVNTNTTEAIAIYVQPWLLDATWSAENT